MIKTGLIEYGVNESQIIIEPEEINAVEKALTIAEPGDLVLIFADNIKRSWKQIIYHGDNTVPESTRRRRFC